MSKRELMEFFCQQVLTSSSWQEAYSRFAEGLDRAFGCGGVWIARRFSRRWHFLAGRACRKGLPPERFDLSGELALFVEDQEALGEYRDFICRLAGLLVEAFPPEGAEKASG